MKWYGISNQKSAINYVSNLKIRNKIKTKLLNLTILSKINLNYNKIIFHIPYSWNFIILQKLNKNFSLCYLYSKCYFFFLPLKKNFKWFYFDQQTNSIVLYSLFTDNFYNLYWTFFKNIFYSFNKIFFKKFKFRGKGYYIYRNKRNVIATQFGYSHLMRLYAYLLSIKFLSKTSIFMYSININNLIILAHKFHSIKPINIFTGKGIRFSRQIIYKKTGKVSSYR